MARLAWPKHLGVVDEKLVKAIEAAALLHDMGKLAAPEYILDKSSRPAITRRIRESSKLHASVGADILSAIAFPYPVVPIVRHHHESWDGSGIPSGAHISLTYLLAPEIPHRSLIAF